MPGNPGVSVHKQILRYTSISKFTCSVRVLRSQVCGLTVACSNSPHCIVQLIVALPLPLTIVTSDGVWAGRASPSVWKEQFRADWLEEHGGTPRCELEISALLRIVFRGARTEAALRYSLRPIPRRKIGVTHSRQSVRCGTDLDHVNRGASM